MASITEIGFVFACGTTKPLWSKDPNKGVSGFKYYNINGSWALKPFIWALGPLGIYSCRGPGFRLAQKSTSTSLEPPDGLFCGPVLLRDVCLASGGSHPTMVRPSPSPCSAKLTITVGQCNYGPHNPQTPSTACTQAA